MKNWLVTGLIFWLIMAFDLQRSGAQNVINNFRFEHLTVDDGLAHSDAMAVIQDHDGFVWVGTNNGINRYDGYELKKYDLPADNFPGMSANRIQVLYADKNGTIWVGTEGAGLYFYNKLKDNFVSIKVRLKGMLGLPETSSLLCKTSIKSIHGDEAGRLWLGTQDYGAIGLKFDQTGMVSQVKRLNLGSARPEDYTALTVFADRKGRVWIGTLEKGLWIFENANNKADEAIATKIRDFPQTDIKTLNVDRRGDLWLSSDNTVYRLDKKHFVEGEWNFKALDYPFRGIQCLSPDASGRLWIGTNFGLVMFDDAAAYIEKPDELAIHTFLPQDADPGSINSARVHQITEDSFNNLWFAASSGGLNKLHLKPKQFGHLHRQLEQTPALPNNYVNAIAKDETKNQLWIGTRNGFSVYDIKSKTYQNYLNRSSKGNVTGVDVSSFLITERNIWIGTRYQGIYITERGKTFNIRPIPASADHNNSWSYMSIERMIQDGSSRVWVASMGAGIILFDPEGKYIKTYNKSNSGLPTNEFSFLLFDKKQNVIWASTRDAGLLKLQEKNGELMVLNQFEYKKNNPNSLKVNFAWPLLKDKNENLWIGTIGGGLHKLVTKNGKETIQRFGHIVAENDIESLLADAGGNLWIGGAGLIKFSPESHSILHYDVSDGLQSNSFKVGSAWQSTDGTMYFGGTNGISFFKPQEILSNPSPPVVRITQFRVLNKNPEKKGNQAGSSMLVRPFSNPDGVVIKADENDFSFEFVGLNYVNPQKQRYAFKLEGYNQEWVNLPPGQRVASFANLPAGEYIFQVKANNGDGIWSVKSDSVQVRILPPWYRTWWSYLIYILLLAAALALYRRIAMSQLKLKNRVAIEKLHAEKEKEIAEMKTNFFTNISHEFRTPLTLILGPMEEFMTSYAGPESMRGKVVLMHKQTRKLLGLVNQLLSFRKIESGHASLSFSQGNAISFLAEIYEIFQIKAEEHHLNYSIEVPSEQMLLYFDPGKLEIIITNLLSNAFKHTQKNGSIHVRATVVGSHAQDAVWHDDVLFNNFLKITVTDSGSGIKPEEIDKIFDPYYQASNSSSSVSGTGIGLALVNELVKSHNGDVQVESTYGKGSSFTIKLPFGKAHISPINLKEDNISHQNELELYQVSSDTSVPEEVSHALRRMKILVVEDNEDLRFYLRDLLDISYEVLLAENGRDGWEKAMDLQPDLILSDVMMPEMNGLEFCKKIKQNPKTSHIPVVLLTARAAAVQELEGLETGADDYVTKPFNSKILMAKIKSILQNRIKSCEFYQKQILLQPTEIIIPDEDKLFLENAMKIVEDNLTNSDFNVQTLVGEMAMSQSVFYRRIKNITGQSVIEFIKDIRLKRAAQLLAGQHSRVSEVAFMVGIEDPKNFRVSFQKRYEMSPSQYAKFHQSKQSV